MATLKTDAPPGFVRRQLDRWLSGRLSSRTYSGQTLRTLATNAILAVLGLVSGVLAARLLGAAGRGELAAIQSWPTLLASLAMLGVQDATIYLGGKNRERLGSIATSATALILIAGIVVGAAGWISMPLLLKAQSGATVGAARAYLLFIVVFAFGGYPVFILRADQRVTAWNLLRIIGPVSWLAVLGDSMLRDVRQARSVATSYLGVSVLISLGLLAYGFRLAGHSKRIDLRLWPDLLRFGFPVFLTTIPQQFNLRLDQLMMATLLSPLPLGLYVVAVAWSAILQPVTMAFASTLFPKIASMASHRDQVRLILKALRVGTMVSLVLSAGAALVTPILLPVLYGPDFRPAVPLAWALLAAAVFSSMIAILQEGLKGMGMPRSVLAAEIAGLAVTAPMLFGLLPRYGAMGAAMTSLVAYATVAAVLLFSLARFSGLRLADLVFALFAGRDP